MVYGGFPSWVQERRLHRYCVCAAFSGNWRIDTSDTRLWQVATAECAWRHHAAHSRLCGQVHPKQLTEALFEEAKQRGCSLKAGRVEKIEIEDKDGTPTVVGVRVDGEVIACDKVVIAMGPWSSSAAQGLHLPPMFGQKYHSVLVQNKRELSQSVFFQGLGDPEVYPRPKGEVYVTGYPDAPIQVEEGPGDEEVRQDVCDRLLGAMKMVSTEVGEAPVTKTQACHLPISVDGDPMIGKHPKVEGAYIATGHGCWGILNAPATGLALSEVRPQQAFACVSVWS